MKTKEESIAEIFDRTKELMHGYVDKMTNRMETAIRESYNAGYRACEKEKQSEYQRGYAAGYTAGVEETRSDMSLQNEESYHQGFDDGYNDWKKHHELIDELKEAEYNRGYAEAEAHYKAERDAAYEEGYNYSERKRKTVVEEIFTLSDEKKKEEYDRGYEDGYNSAVSEDVSEALLRGIAQGMNGIWDMINFFYDHDCDQHMKREIAEDAGTTQMSMKGIAATTDARSFYYAVKKYINMYFEKPAKGKDTLTNAQKFAEVFGRDIYSDLNLDRDGRAFTIKGDNSGCLMQSDWLFEEYKEPET